VLLAAAGPGQALQDAPSPGYAIGRVPNPTPFQTSAALSSGDVVAFDGLDVRLYPADGSSPVVLFGFGGFVFGGLFEVDPSESFLLLGESSFGGVYRVDLGGGGGTPLGTMAFNFDAAFDTPTTAIVSAATCGFSCGNDLIRIDTTTGLQVPVAHLSGPSGPLALDPAGNLFYATQSDSFPPTAGAQSVVLLTAAQLGSGSAFGDGDALVVSSGWDGGSSLAFDSTTATLLMAENNFGDGTNRIYRLGATKVGSELLVDGAPFGWISGLAFAPGASAAKFQAFQPAGGGRLTFASTDFFSYDDRSTLEPARAAGGVSGAGTTGVGPLEFAVAGALPGGFVAVAFGPQWLYSPVESTYAFPFLPPIHTGLDLATIQFWPALLPCDAAGNAVLGAFNPGGLEGLVAVQGVLTDAWGVILGTSTGATF
jgi:hypothetical protein